MATQTKKTSTTDLAKALGASHTATIGSNPHGPFGAIALVNEVRNRLISQGGRPADAEPTIRRLVPLRTHVWKALQALARKMSARGKPVSPGQLAALLLERSVAALAKE